VAIYSIFVTIESCLLDSSSYSNSYTYLLLTLIYFQLVTIPIVTMLIVILLVMQNAVDVTTIHCKKMK